MSDAQVIAMHVDNADGWANDPRLIVTFLGDKPEDKVWKEAKVDGGTVYLAQTGPFISHLTHVPGNERGFGGTVYELTMEDGSERKVKGPWSGMPQTKALFGVEYVDISAIWANMDQLEAIWAKRKEYLAELRRGPHPPSELSDDRKVYWYSNLVESLTRMQNLNAKARFAYHIEHQHRQAFFATSGGSYFEMTEHDREWDGSPEQVKVAGLLAMHFVPEGVGYAMCLERGFVEEQMKEHAKDHVLYEREWAPDTYTGEKEATLVAAQRTMDGTPKPKNIGWWGYAVVNRQSKPESAFYDDIDFLLEECTTQLASNLELRVMGYNGEGWSQLYPKIDSKVRWATEQKRREIRDSRKIT